MSLEIPKEMFKSDVNVRLAELLRVIQDRQDLIGASLYELSIATLLEAINGTLNQLGKEGISDRTMYRYLRQAQREGWLRKITQAVKAYAAISISPPEPSVLPSFFISREGQQVAPEACPEEIYAETGEKTLVTYQLTERGHAILQQYLALKNQTQEE